MPTSIIAIMPKHMKRAATIDGLRLAGIVVVKGFPAEPLWLMSWQFSAYAGFAAVFAELSNGKARKTPLSL
jgi:hypothetical protein